MAWIVSSLRDEAPLSWPPATISVATSPGRIRTMAKTTIDTPTSRGIISMTRRRTYVRNCSYPQPLPFSMRTPWRGGKGAAPLRLAEGEEITALPLEHALLAPDLAHVAEQHVVAVLLLNAIAAPRIAAVVVVGVGNDDGDFLVQDVHHLADQPRPLGGVERRLLPRPQLVVACVLPLAVVRTAVSKDLS